MQPTNQSCGACLYWTQLPSEVQKADMPMKGLCRLNPPEVFMLPVNPKNDSEGRKFTMQHPVMLEGGWCGQWKGSVAEPKATPKKGAK